MEELKVKVGKFHRKRNNHKETIIFVLPLKLTGEK